MAPRLVAAPLCRMNPTIIVTTSRRSSQELWRQAEQWAQRLGARAVARQGSLAHLCEQYDADGVLTITDDRLVYREPASGLEYFFHPGMAKVRIHNIEAGRGDPMIAAMQLRPGDELLDCTVGRASDAIVAAYVADPQGRILGLEKVPVIAQLTIHGLATYEDSSRKVTELLRRIEVVQADYNDYLPTCATASFDIVYFDPVFHEPVEKSEPMKPLRALADKATVTAEALQQALRVARRRVVIKQRYGTPLWDQLGITQVLSSSSSRIEYGIAEP